MLSPSHSRARLVAVALPGGVWLDEQDSAPRRVLALRSLSATEELSCIDDRRSPAERATELLTRCVTGGDAIVPALTVGDREAALLHLRRLTFGERLEAIVTCASPACGARLELQLSTSDLLLAPYGELSQLYDVVIERPEGEYAVTFRLPSSSDLSAAALVAHENPDRGADLILRRCVTACRLSGACIASERIPAPVRAAVAQAMSDRDPQAEITLSLQCPECGCAFAVILDTAGFFLRELEQRASNLIRDVHVLASHYHWSEDDILRLPAWRRSRYLQLVADASGQGEAT